MSSENQSNLQGYFLQTVLDTNKPDNLVFQVLNFFELLINY